MYTLQVFYDGSPVAHATHEYRAAGEVLSAIPVLLGQHDGCEKIVVSLNATPLFAVDCKGNRLPA